MKVMKGRKVRDARDVRQESEGCEGSEGCFRSLQGCPYICDKGPPKIHAFRVCHPTLSAIRSGPACTVRDAALSLCTLGGCVLMDGEKEGRRRRRRRAAEVRCETGGSQKGGNKRGVPGKNLDQRAETEKKKKKKELQQKSHTRPFTSTFLEARIRRGPAGIEVKWIEAVFPIFDS